MPSALQTAVLGMRAYEDMLNVTGNNIANADTTGFKSDRVIFAEMFYRTLNMGTRATQQVGGTNPIQVGLGVKLAGVDRDMSQGSFSSTGKPFDLAIDGEGFFVLSDGTTNYFTRDGSFDVDAEGYLVDPSTGYRVQRIGTVGEEEGFQASGVSDIRIPLNTVLPGRATSTIEFVGNLSADDDSPTTSKLESSNLTYTLVSGGLADETADFSQVEQLQGFADGDVITISGRSRDGTPVSGTFTYGAANDGTTLNDLMVAIENVFGGAVDARMENGKIVVEDNTAGYSLLDVDLSCAAHPDAVPADFDYVSVGGAAAQTTNSIVYDSLGRQHTIGMTFVRQSADSNVWDLVVNHVTGAERVTDRRIVGISFEDDGSLREITGIDGFGNTSSTYLEWDENISFQLPGIAGEQRITGDFGTVGQFDGLTQFGGDSTAGAVDQDGYSYGSLQSISVDNRGVIKGTFSNGESIDIARIRVATFGNTQGLVRIGNNYYAQTASSGSLVYTGGMEGRAGRIRQNVLEDSNVNIAQEFTRLIIAQRGFQVNSRTVRIANQMLQQLASIVL